MSIPTKTRWTRAVTLTAVLVLACGDANAPPAFRQVAAVIAAEPVTLSDTLTVGQSVTLRLDAGTRIPTEVRWWIEPATDSTTSSTIILHATIGGSAVVRARAMFGDSAVANAVRTFVIRTNSAPQITPVFAPLVGTRFPVGGPVPFAMSATDPDGDSITPDSMRWYRIPADGSPAVPLGTGPTLDYTVADTGIHMIRFDVADPHGSTATYATGFTGYDPLSPVLWRSPRMSMRALSWSPAGILTANLGQGNAVCDCPLLAWDGAGNPLWAAGAIPGVGPIVADNSGVYFYRNDGILYAYDLGGTERWSRPEAVLSPAQYADGSLALPVTSGAVVALARLDADGTARWQTTLDSIPQANRVTIGLDGTAYVARTGMVAAVASDGTLLWQRSPGAGGVRDLIVLSDSRIALVAADSVRVMDLTGTVVWTLPAADHVVASAGVAYVIASSVLRRYDAVSGSPLGATPLPNEPAFGPTTTGTPVLTADGGMLVRIGLRWILMDVATGIVRWRHDFGDLPLADPLLLDDGTLIAAGGFVEAMALGVGPAPGPWPMGGASAGRSRRAQP